MRSKRTFLSATSLAALMVLAAMTAPAAAGQLPMACTSVGTGAFRIEVIQGPCPVTSETSPACAASGLFTGIKYRITGTPDHIATLVNSESVVSKATGNLVYSPGYGDPWTGLGRLAYHERAVKFGTESLSGEFWLVVQGEKAPTMETMIAKKGTNRPESCAIAGFGDERDPPPPTDACVSACGNFHPDQVLKKTEVLTFKHCSVIFTYDLTTGQVIDAHLTPESVDCDFFQASVSDVQVTVNVPGGGSLGLGKFGDGYISTGTESCTTRIIGGRVYTWGNPCPN